MSVERNAPASLYIAHAGERGPYKVGISQSPEMRQRGIQTGNSNRIVMEVVGTWQRWEARAIERSVHSILKQHRIQGEWFAASLDVVRDAISRAASRRWCDDCGGTGKCIQHGHSHECSGCDGTGIETCLMCGGEYPKYDAMCRDCFPYHDWDDQVDLPGHEGEEWG